MKSYCKGLALDRESVERAYARWRSGESGSKNEHRVYEEYGTPGALVEEIAFEIASRTLTFRPIRRYPKRESTNGKLRIIGVESVKQQVCDYLADDGFIFGSCKRDLEMALRGLERFYSEGYGLSLKGWKVSRCGNDEPVRALGYTVRPDRVTIKDDLYLRIRAAYRNFDRDPTEAAARRVTSYWGYLEHSDSMKAIEAHGYLGTVKRARRLVSAVDGKRRERQANDHHD